MNIQAIISRELNVKESQVEAAVNLLDEGATVPFISRYRKEVTGGLSDTQLRQLDTRLQSLRELEDRRQTILKTIDEQGNLTDDLKKKLLSADNKTTLEDLYLPYKPKRRTKAQIAKEAGLEPLALAIFENPEITPEDEAEKYINEEKAIANSSDALDGARHILLERFSEDAELIAKLREKLWHNGLINSKVVKDKEKDASKFSDYFEYSEAANKIPSHRALALFRGRNEGFLRINLQFADQSDEEQCYKLIARHFDIQHKSRAADDWLWQTVEWVWKIKLSTKLELELMGKVREQAEEEAIRVFQENLGNLLMMAPAGNKVVLGLDPGLRTGVKVVVVDGTGKLLEYTTIFPHAPRNQWDESISVLAKLAEKYKVELVSIGNGTASRETDRLVIELSKLHPKLNLTKLVVSEAGASVYSASELAAAEFPDLDVSYRGAVSIARRLQDPLAELVKIDPKSIGVGQYQHDVNQVKLNSSLKGVLEDCVNAVGADVNTASVPLLASISGLNEGVAKNIVAFREENGRFSSREKIKSVPRMGDKTFEQAIGFLRIINGDNPLDASAVHPESYPVVENILQKSGKSIKQIMGDSSSLESLNPNDFTSEQFGLPTVKDIFGELKKPGRDPRPEFVTATFQEGIETLSDLSVDMVLEGVITNVTKFGAFVDIGVHQDGLVHISKMSNTYVSDPSKIVKVGQVVKVKVIEIDLPRKRVSLSMQLGNDNKAVPQAKRKTQQRKEENKPMSALAVAFREALG